MEFLPPNPQTRVTEEDVLSQGLLPNPAFESPYLIETPILRELRRTLHGVSLTMGRVHHFDENAILPRDTFSPTDLENMGIPEDATHISMNAYERTEHSIYQEDSGDGPGNFTLTLTERDRYIYEDAVEPIRGSITLKSTKGNFCIGFIVPSRHFEESQFFTRDEDELKPPRLITEIVETKDGVTAEQIFVDFLQDCDPDFIDIFSNLEPILERTKIINNNSENNEWVEMTAIEAAAIERFYRSIYG